MEPYVVRDRRASAPQAGKAVSLSAEDHARLLEHAKQAEHYKDQYLRLLADAENATRRLERAREEAIRFSAERIVKQLLPILDSFEQAVKVFDGPSAPSSQVQTGVRLIYQQLLQLLEKEGVRRIDAVGKPFDHRYHEAVQQVETNGSPEDTVVEQIQVGYTLQDKVLRPALVKVAKKPDDQKAEVRRQKSETSQ